MKKGKRKIRSIRKDKSSGFRDALFSNARIPGTRQLTRTTFMKVMKKLVRTGGIPRIALNGAMMEERGVK